MKAATAATAVEGAAMAREDPRMTRNKRSKGEGGKRRGRRNEERTRER